jgi:hypothetical protein
MSSFVRRQLRFTFTLSNNASFEGTNSNTLVLEGLRAVCNIKTGAPLAPTSQVQVYGMKPSDMNALTMLAWTATAIQRNTLQIDANNGDGWSTIFLGQIIEAMPDYTAAPDVMLRVQAVAQYLDKIKPADPSQYTSATPVADIVGTLAQQMGYTVENNGVTTTLSDPYLPGTRVEQLQNVCKQAGVDYYVDGSTVAICPAGKPREGDPILITPDTGLIMSPTFDVVGVHLMVLFNPAIRFGGSVKVDAGDAVPQANGTWCVYAMDHQLESEKPGGAWFSHLSCNTFGQPVVAL